MAIAVVPLSPGKRSDVLPNRLPGSHRCAVTKKMKPARHIWIDPIHAAGKYPRRGRGNCPQLQRVQAREPQQH